MGDSSPGGWKQRSRVEPRANQAPALLPLLCDLGQIAVVSGLSCSISQESAEGKAEWGCWVTLGIVFSISPLPSCRSYPCHALPFWRPPARPTWLGLEQSSQPVGLHDNAFSLHSSGWGLGHQGPPFLGAPLLDLPMPLMGTSPTLPTEARCSIC